MAQTSTQCRRRSADFQTEGTRCAAWLYTPTDVADPPVVVMAHGFGGERTWGLPAFAERFTTRGLAVLLFDYRNFGDSDGEPRNLISPTRHVQDWLTAIDHARGLSEVDGSRIGLWGMSFSGGHVLTAAARVGDIDAIVAQTPFTDGLAALRAGGGGIGTLGRAVASGVRDVVGSAVVGSPYYVPIAGSPDEFGVLTRPGTRAGFASIADDDWDNRCPARIFLTVGRYRPITTIDEIDCPTLVVEAEDDGIIPPATVDRLVDRLADVDYLAVPGRHFDPFHGEIFERVVAREADFLHAHLT